VPLPFLKRLAEGRAEGGRYVQNWARDFDYLYLVGPPVANPMPDILDEVMHARRFTLYRIRRGISSGGEDGQARIAHGSRHATNFSARLPTVQGRKQWWANSRDRFVHHRRRDRRICPACGWLRLALAVSMMLCL